jgi:Tol biopolymer transport system component
VERLDGTGRRAVIGKLQGRSPAAIARVDQAVFSPDGRQIAYATTDRVHGNPEILRVPVAGGRVRQLWYASGLDAGGSNLGIAWRPA